MSRSKVMNEKTEWNRQTKNMFISSSSAKFEEKLFVYNVVVVVVWDAFECFRTTGILRPCQNL